MVSSVVSQLHSFSSRPSSTLDLAALTAVQVSSPTQQADIPLPAFDVSERYERDISLRPNVDEVHFVAHVLGYAEQIFIDATIGSDKLEYCEFRDYVELVLGLCELDGLKIKQSALRLLVDSLLESLSTSDINYEEQGIEWDQCRVLLSSVLPGLLFHRARLFASPRIARSELV